VPALKSVGALRLTAVSTTREESASELAALTGADHAFTSAEDLAAYDDVNLVVVAVKVPQHRQLIEQVVAAGKWA
jgi:predicted dehydrogenase